MSRVAQDENVRMLRQLQCGSDSDSSRTCPLHPQRIQDGSRFDARRPDQRMGGDLPAVVKCDSLSLEVRQFCVQQNFHMLAAQQIERGVA